jgi:predicted  nucleic acid-binding Zn-ribbon protein
MDNFSGKFDFSHLPSPLDEMKKKTDATFATNMRIIEETRREREAIVEKRHQETLDELRAIKSNLSEKLDSANSTLEIMLNSLGHNMQLLQREQIHTNEKLAELNMLIAKRDQKGIKKFLETHGFESVGLVLQLISMFTGK